MDKYRAQIIDKIKVAGDIVSIETIINASIRQLKEKGVHSHIVVRFIQKLDLSLVTISHEGLTDKQQSNIKEAQKILINKMLYGEKEKIF